MTNQREPAGAWSLLAGWTLASLIGWARRESSAWQAWQSFCAKWGKDYRSIKKMGSNPFYKYYFTYLNYHPRIQAMIYTTNWIERLQRDF